MTRNPKTIAFWRGKLPHWEVEDGRYFVTIHLAGAIPKQGQEKVRLLCAEFEQLAQADTDGRLKVQRRVFADMEAWLDRAQTNTHLNLPEVAQLVMESIDYRDGRDWHLFEYVVMPTHLHLFFELVHGDLKSTLDQFKRWTGHQAAKLLHLDGDRFWQDEWFDHWSRSDEEDERIIQYIRENPEKAGLVASYLQWPYGGWRRRGKA